MTLDTIKNYFLKAGASFRNSELWKHDFLNEEGKSEIARTGRFGVGALSAFLIGEKIEVCTRHYTEHLGYKFECNIDEDEIEITRVPAPIGTTIKIVSNKKRLPKVANYLRRNSPLPFYYILTDPSIDFRINNVTVYSSPRSIKLEMEANPSKWIEAKTGKYEKILWDRTIVARSTYPHSGFLYCNGIVVGDIDKPSNSLVISGRGHATLSINAPTVAVTDRDAKLPIDLARKGLSKPDVELSQSVQTSVAEQFLAELYASPGSSPSALHDWWLKLKHFIDSRSWGPFLLGKDGFTLLDGSLFKKVSPSFMIVQSNDYSVIERQMKDKFFIDNDIWTARMGGGSISTKTDILNFLRDYPRLKFPNFSTKSYGQRPPFRNCCYILPKSYEKVFDLSSVANYIRGMTETQLVLKDGISELVVLDRFGNTSREVMNEIGQFVMRTTTEDSKGKRSIKPLIVFSGVASKEEEPSFLSAAWEASFTGSYLPYDSAARATLLREEAPIIKYL